MKSHYTSAFEAQVVVELLKEEKTLAQLAAEYKVSPKVLRDWKTLALKGLPSLFEKRDDLVAVQASAAVSAGIGCLLEVIQRAAVARGSWLSHPCRSLLAA